MNPESHDTAREAYTLGYSESVVNSLVQRAAVIGPSYLVPHLQSGMRLLDVGCGPGSITLDLAAMVAPGDVVGIDLDAGQVARAQALADERGTTNVRFEVGDAYELPFPDSSFDAVHANAVLLHLRDPLAGLREFWRVLRRGGVVGINDVVFPWVREPTTPLLREYEVLFRRYLDLERGRTSEVLDFKQRGLLQVAGFSGAEAGVQTESFGTSDQVRQVGTRAADRMDGDVRAVVVAEGLADHATVDRIVNELREWSERSDSSACNIWCYAIAWKE